MGHVAMCAHRGFPWFLVLLSACSYHPPPLCDTPGLAGQSMAQVPWEAAEVATVQVPWCLPFGGCLRLGWAAARDQLCPDTLGQLPHCSCPHRDL